MLEKRIQGSSNVELLNIDLLDFDREMQLDLVYSIGLIEHFAEQDRLKVIRVHFDLLKPGGFAIISFPTPTWLYRISRQVSEKLKLWIWHDEIPLKLEEVVKLAAPFGQVKDSRILWLMFLTQAMIVVQKSP